MALSSSPQALPESEKKSFSVASLVRSVKNGYHKVMDCVKDQVPSFDRKTLVLLGALATPAAMANTPPSWAPLAPIASSVMTSPSWAPANELDKALADIFQSYTMPESPLVSPLASENQAWSLFPVQEIRDIGASKVPSPIMTAAKKEHHPQHPQKGRPDQGNHVLASIAHREEDADWHADAVDAEWVLDTLPNIASQEYAAETQQVLELFIHQASVAGRSVHLRDTTRTDERIPNGPSGADMLKGIVGETGQMTKENWEDVLTKVFVGYKGYTEAGVHALQYANDMIGEINRLGKTHPGFTESLVSQLNRVVPKITNSTPSAMQEVFHGTVELMKAFHGDAATRAKIEVSDALFEVARHTIPSEHILEVVVPDTHPSADGKTMWEVVPVLSMWQMEKAWLFFKSPRADDLPLAFSAPLSKLESMAKAFAQDNNHQMASIRTARKNS